MESVATCPLCDLGLDELEGWDTAPENAIARHLIRAHDGWEQELGLFAKVLDVLGGEVAADVVVLADD